MSLTQLEEERPNEQSVSESANNSDSVVPSACKSLSQICADFQKRREQKDNRKQASLENFNAELKKYSTDIKLEFDVSSKLQNEHIRPMNYENFSKNFDFMPHIL
jgi:hypothetical protein